MSVAMSVTVTVSMTMSMPVMPMMSAQEAEDAMAMPAMPNLLDKAAFAMGDEAGGRDDRRGLGAYTKQPES